MANRIVHAFLLGAIWLLSPACERSEIGERYYRDYKQLGTSDEPGNWVPSFIPRSAVEIRTRYTIDTGGELLMFNFAEFTEIPLTGHCNKAAVSDLEFPPHPGS